MALSDWCARQPEMIAHNGLCLVHRAQLKLIEGIGTPRSRRLVDPRTVSREVR
jgi:hypothetical protein